jgi:N-methylhydantoinase A
VLEREALAELEADTHAAAQPPGQVRWRAELRYAGQGFELSIDLPSETPGEETDVVVRRRFGAEYARTYGHELAGRRIDFVALRVIATQAPQGRSFAAVKRTARTAPLAQSRSAYFGRSLGLIDTPVIGRQQLEAAPRPGPLIVEEYEGTTVVPPGALAGLDAFNNLVITLRSGAPQ